MSMEVINPDPARFDLPSQIRHTVHGADEFSENIQVRRRGQDVEAGNATPSPDGTPSASPSPAAEQPGAPPKIPAAPTRQRPEPRAKTPPPAPEASSRPARRRWLRIGLFALLPLALIAGAYWYITGGQIMSTDDAYVNIAPSY